MSRQEQIKKPVIPKVSKTEADKLAEKDAEEQVEAAQGKETNLDETDDLLDEIDGLLEEQDVLVNYKQRGGE